MAVRAVKDAATPAFRQALDLGQLIDHAGGEDDAPCLQGLAARHAYLETVVEGTGLRGGAFDPLHGRVGEQLGPCVGHDVAGRAPVLAKEAV
jgi:hypothetical protein